MKMDKKLLSVEGHREGQEERGGQPKGRIEQSQWTEGRVSSAPPLHFTSMFKNLKVEKGKLSSPPSNQNYPSLVCPKK